jgi:hypothetical protein
MFLRNGCLLPEGFRLKQERFNKGWMSAGDISSTGLDVTLRSAGWHFMWVQKACSRFGCGRTEAAAVSQATTRALDRISERFNAAEVDSVKVSNYPGFRIARVTAHARQIQEQDALSAIDATPIRQFSVG